MSSRNRYYFLATTTTTTRRTVIYRAILNCEIFRFWSPMPALLSAGTRVSRGEWRRASCSSQCAAALSRCSRSSVLCPSAAAGFIYETLTAAASQQRWEVLLKWYCRIINYNCSSLIYLYVRLVSTLCLGYISDILLHLSWCFSYIISS